MCIQLDDEVLGGDFGTLHIAARKASKGSAVHCRDDALVVMPSLA